jgi:hypothetical protein
MPQPLHAPVYTAQPSQGGARAPRYHAAGTDDSSASDNRAVHARASAFPSRSRPFSSVQRRRRGAIHARQGAPPRRCPPSHDCHSLRHRPFSHPLHRQRYFVAPRPRGNARRNARRIARFDRVRANRARPWRRQLHHHRPPGTGGRHRSGFAAGACAAEMIAPWPPRGSGRRPHCEVPADERLGRLRELHALVCLALRQSAATVPKSYPGTEMRGIGSPRTRSIIRTIAISSGAMKVKASPVAAARPVRPMRCT